MLDSRFTSKFIISDTGCWLWTACTDPSGYGLYRDGKKLFKAHRFAFEDANGPIPEGLSVLHRNSCHTRNCVNPLHCYLGNQLDNMRDVLDYGTNPRVNATHCPSGHPYDEENTYIYVGDGGSRHCRACGKLKHQKRNELKRRK